MWRVYWARRPPLKECHHPLRRARVPAWWPLLYLVVILGCKADQISCGVRSSSIENRYFLTGNACCWGTGNSGLCFKAHVRHYIIWHDAAFLGMEYREFRVVCQSQNGPSHWWVTIVDKETPTYAPGRNCHAAAYGRGSWLNKRHCDTFHSWGM